MYVNDGERPQHCCPSSWYDFDITVPNIYAHTGGHDVN